MIITTHAIERYVKRIEPSISLQNARRAVERIIANSTPIGKRTKSGESQRIANDGSCVLVTKRVKDSKTKNIDDILVTILGPNESFEIGDQTDPYQLERELYNELMQYKEEKDKKAEDAKNRLKKRLEGARELNRENGVNKDYSDTERLLKSPYNKKFKNLVGSCNDAVRRFVIYENHRTNLDRTKRKLANALRVALKTLSKQASDGDVDALDALLEIKNIEPGYLDDEFINAGIDKHGRRIYNGDGDENEKSKTD